MKRHNFAGTIATVVLAFIAPATSLAQTAGLSISPSGYNLVGSSRVDRSDSYFTYQAVLNNTGGALSGVTATITSLASNVTVVAGQGTLEFSPVPAGTAGSPSAVTSTNSFTILVNSSVPFDWSQVSWSFNNPFAAPGPNQNVPVQSTVTLNGGGSTNPGGVGSLSYSWAFQSVPPGSTAQINNANNVIATFKADLIGTYVAALTVNNGSQSDTNTVTISTNDIPPTAVAGSNQTVAFNSTVLLDGTGSTDANGQPLTYLWSMVSSPPASNAALSSVRAPRPTFTADVNGGTWIIGLVVNDGMLSSPMSTVTITTGHTPPVAVALANGLNPATVSVSGLVTLDGTKSTDVNSNPLTYSWSLNTSGAPNSKAVLSATNIAMPTFTADVAGTYVAQLIVNDGVSNSQPATVTITANGGVTAPTANASATQAKIIVGNAVNLLGSGVDPQGYPLTYTWTLPTFPAGSSAPSSFPTHLQNPTFVADQIGTYTAQLVVNDGVVNSAPSTVTITSTAVPPVAVPSTTTPSVGVGTSVSLSGASSFDPDNDPIISYTWTLSVPPGSSARLTGGNTEYPSFTPDIPGTFVAQLIVADKYLSSAPVTVSITAGQTGITLSPNPLNISLTPQVLTISVSPGGGGSPLLLSLTGYDPGVISLSTDQTLIPANSNSVNITVTPIGAGTTSVTANIAGYPSVTGTVVVTTPTISLAFDNNATTVGLTHTIGGTVILSAPAPSPNGTNVTLEDIQDHDSGGQPGLVTFNPTSVFIPAGTTTGTFQMFGAQLGGIEILPAAPGYQRVNFIVSSVTILGSVSLPANLSVPAGQSTALNIQLSSPAPEDGATITLQSSDTTKATVSPATVTISPGATTPATAPKVTGVATGTAGITASSGGYTGSTATVSVTAAANITLPCPATTTGEAGVAFSSQVTAVGGSGSYTYSVVGGLPSGLSLNSSTGAITGTPTGAGTFSIKVTDSNNATATSCTFTINPALSLPCPATTSGNSGSAFSSQTTASGGSGSYTYSVVGALPAGLSLNTSTGAITGTPTVAGTFSIKVTDSAGVTATSCTFTINGALSLPCPVVTTGDMNMPFSGQVTAAGGTGSYTYSVAGRLPAGLSLNTSTGAITGTPTATGTFSVTVTDSNGATATSCMFTINPALSLLCPAVTSGDANVAFSGQVTASGGSGSYTYSVVGALPAGLSLNSSTGAVTGTPTAAGTFSIKVTDSAGGTATSCPFTINSAVSVPCPPTVFSVVGNPFNTQVTASGGTGSYTYSVSGTLPAGLSLNTSTGAITGTPTVTGTFGVKATDAIGGTATSCTFTINSTLSLPCPAATSGNAGTAFSSQVAASGGSGSYTYSVVGALPAGLSLNTTTGAITGTPTASGTFSIKVTDGNGASATSCPFTISPSTALQITTASLPSGVLNVAYSAAIVASGGTPSYSWSLGNAPRWLTINPSTGVISGNPNRGTGTSQVQVFVTDSSNPQQSASATFNLVVNATATLQITTTLLPSALLNTVYSATVSATGGTPSYTWSLGTAPAWVTINPATGAIGGTPTGSAGTVQVQVTVTDSGSPQLTASMTYSLVISGGGGSPLALSCPATTTGAVGSAFSGQVTASGGTGPYTYSVVGTLPAGLSLNSSSGAITGTPTAAGTFSIMVTDSKNATATSCMFTVTATSQFAIVTATLPSGILGLTYSTTLSASGGNPAYTWSIMSGPSWLTINSSTGALSGNPRQTTTYQGIQIMVTDSTGATASMTYSLTINQPSLSFVTTSLPNATLNIPYSQAIVVIGGVPPYNWQTTGLPTWLVFDATGAACSSNVPTLCGTAPAFGNFTFTISVTDSAGLQVSQTLTLTVNSQNGVATMALTGGSKNTASFSVGQNLQVPMSVTFNPPPTANVQVTFTSSSPGTVLFTSGPEPQGNPPPAPASSLTVTVDAQPSFIVFVQGAPTSSGQITITATSQNYGTATATVTVGRSGFVLQGPTGGVGGSFSTFQGNISPMQAGPALLDSNNMFVEYEAIAYGQSYAVPLTVTPSTLGTLTTPLVFSSNTGSLNGASGGPNFTSSTVNTGGATLSIGQPSGFTAPAAGASVNVTVNPSGFVPPTLTIGSNLQVQTSISTNGSAGVNTPVILQSNDPNLQFSATETGPSSGTLTLTVAQGFSSTQNFWVRAYSSTGSATYSITGGSFGTTTATVTYGPSGLVLQTPSGSDANFTATTSVSQANLIISTALVNGAGYPVQIQEVAADQSLSVSVGSTNNNVGTISVSTLTIAGASSTTATSFVPVAVGTAGISVGSAGFQPSGAAIQGVSVSVSVIPCNINIQNNLTIGQYLEGQGTFILGCPAPAGGTTITLTSNSSFVQLAINPTDPGSNSIVLNIPQGQSFGNYWIYGLGTGMANGEGASPASGTYSAAVNGFAAGPGSTDTVFFAPSAILILGPNNSIGGTSMSVASGPQTLTLITDALTTDGNFTPVPSGIQPLMGNAGNVPLAVALSNSSSAAGTLALSTINIQPGSSGGTVLFTPTTAGDSTSISVTQPGTFQGTVGLYGGSFDLTQFQIQVTQ